MKLDDGISTQGAFLVNCAPNVRQGIFVECPKLCLCNTIQFYKPNTQEAACFKPFSITLNSENRALCTPKIFRPKYEECTFDINWINCSVYCSESCFCLLVLHDPELCLSGIKIKQKVSPVIPFLTVFLELMYGVVFSLNSSVLPFGRLAASGLDNRSSS